MRYTILRIAYETSDGPCRIFPTGTRLEELHKECSFCDHKSKRFVHVAYINVTKLAELVEQGSMYFSSAQDFIDWTMKQ